MDKRKTKDKSRKAPKIVDLNDYRRNKNEERRREYERVLFNRVLGVYSFVEKGKLQHVETADISYSGIKFRETKPELPIKVGNRVALRFYFTPGSYLRIVVQVKRVTPFEDNGRSGLEYGCELDTKTKSYTVLKQLVEFMHQYSEIACQDTNPPLVFF